MLIANADLVAPRETDFSLEPGFYGHLLLDRGITDIRFFGKPFPEVYALVEDSLPQLNPSEIIMCGDTLHTDIFCEESDILPIGALSEFNTPRLPACRRRRSWLKISNIRKMEMHSGLTWRRYPSIRLIYAKGNKAISKMLYKFQRDHACSGMAGRKN